MKPAHFISWDFYLRYQTSVSKSNMWRFRVKN